MRKGFVLLLVLVPTIAVAMNLQAVNPAKGYPIYEIPPKVNVPQTSVNASISKINGELWVNVDAEYVMHAVYALGDSYVAENTGFGLIADPSPYVQVTVTQDALEAHFPTPFNAVNVSATVDGETVELQQDPHGYFHLFDADMPEINWTVSPVPRDFTVAVHYEQPISKTSKTYAYLGDYAFTLPLYGRFGCSNISYPLYSWYGYPPNEYKVQVEPSFSKMQTYLIAPNGTLTHLNVTTVVGGSEGVEISFSRAKDDLFVHGAVVVFNDASGEAFSVVPVAAVVVIGVALGAGLLLYRRKRHKEAART